MTYRPEQLNNQPENQRGTEDNPDSLITRVWGDFCNKFNGPSRVRDEISEAVSAKLGLNFGRTASLCYAMNKGIDHDMMAAYNEA